MKLGPKPFFYYYYFQTRPEDGISLKNQATRLITTNLENQNRRKKWNTTPFPTEKNFFFNSILQCSFAMRSIRTFSAVVVSFHCTSYAPEMIPCQTRRFEALPPFFLIPYQDPFSFSNYAISFLHTISWYTLNTIGWKLEIEFSYEVYTRFNDDKMNNGQFFLCMYTLPAGFKCVVCYQNLLIEGKWKEKSLPFQNLLRYIKICMWTEKGKYNTI